MRERKRNFAPCGRCDLKTGTNSSSMYKLRFLITGAYRLKKLPELKMLCLESGWTWSNIERMA
jgi:hypothetical protein